MAIPGLGLITGPAKDIGKSFSYGFDVAGNVKHDGIRGLFSGFHPHIGGATIGGVAGGYIGARFGEDGSDAATTAIGGAAIGGAILPAAGLAGAGAYGLGKGIWNNADKIVDGAVATGKWAGRAGLRSVVGPQFKGGKTAELGNRLLNPIARHASFLNKVSENFVKIEPKRQVYDAAKERMVTKGGVKLGAIGWGVIGVGGAIGAVRGANQALNNSRMGMRDPYISTATPRTPSPYNNAGASGDLVFALNANRRG